MTYSLIVVGSGNMARTHMRHWQRIPEVQIDAVVSVDLEHANTLAPPGARVFANLAEALAVVRPEIVDICTPTPTHRDLAVLAASHGAHIFLEKPMGRTLQECDDVIAAAEAAGVLLMTGHVVRFFPEFAAAKRLITEGAVGRPAAARSARLAAHPRGGWRDWYADPALSGGVLLDMVIHDFDWMRWCFGDVERVYAKGLYGRSEYVGSLDYGLVTLRFASGMIGHVCGSWAHPGGFRTTFEVCGDGGMLEHDSACAVPFAHATRAVSSGPSAVAVPESPMSKDDDPYYLELHHFVDCLISGVSPSVTPQDARAAVAVSLAALDSIRTGQPISLA